MAPALHLLHETRGAETKTKKRRTTRDTQATPSLPRPFEAGSGSKRGRRTWGSGQVIEKVRFDEGKRRLLNLDFVPPDLEFVPPSLDFVPKDLDFLQRCGLRDRDASATGRASPGPRRAGLRFERARSPGEPQGAVGQWTPRSSVRPAWPRRGGPRSAFSQTAPGKRRRTTGPDPSRAGADGAASVAERAASSNGPGRRPHGRTASLTPRPLPDRQAEPDR